MIRIFKKMSLLACLAGLALAQQQNKAGDPKSKAAAAKSGAKKATAAKPHAMSSPGPISIPRDAVEIEAGLFQAKDAAGKTWHYTRTPFGVRKFEPQHREDTAAEESALITVAGQEGDTVRFERKTPWGAAKWSRKMAELNAAEKLAMERSKAPASHTGAATAKASKQ